MANLLVWAILLAAACVVCVVAIPVLGFLLELAPLILAIVVGLWIYHAVF